MENNITSFPISCLLIAYRGTISELKPVIVNYNYRPTENSFSCYSFLVTFRNR
jgi:hypothetical protein